MMNSKAQQWGPSPLKLLVTLRNLQCFFYKLKLFERLGLALKMWRNSPRSCWPWPWSRWVTPAVTRSRCSGCRGRSCPAMTSLVEEKFASLCCHFSDRFHSDNATLEISHHHLVLILLNIELYFVLMPLILTWSELEMNLIWATLGSLKQEAQGF